jgi:4-amino-4-deoxy-L-arabinose transferase-like glycosyltransferase
MRRDYLLIIGLGVLLFLPRLGSVHLFDWDEVNFAECAREMLLTGDWMRPQIDYEPFWEKPPLFLWMQAFSMYIFGVNEFAARFPNAICGILTLLVVYRIGFRLYDRMFAWLWVLAWVGSILPHLYFKSGIIDPWFNLFIFTGLYGFVEFRWQLLGLAKGTPFWTKYRHLLLGGLVLGLAVMTKGPAAVLIMVLVMGAYWAVYKFRGIGILWHGVLFFAAAGVAALAWFGLEYALHGDWFIREFLTYQVRLFQTEDSGHAGFFGYHAVVLLLGCFPASVFALSNLWGDRSCEDEVLEAHPMEDCRRSDFRLWMQILFWVVLILFSIVKTKIVHYSSLCYFPLTFLAALTFWRASNFQVFSKRFTWLMPLVGVLVGGAVMALPWIGKHISILEPLVAKDAFASEAIHAPVEWSFLHGLPGLVLVCGMVLGYLLWRKNYAWLTAQAVFISGASFTGLTMLLVVCNIEDYSQGAAIEFYQHHCDEVSYVKPVGFKSYAHLFYTNKAPVKDSKADDWEQLCCGDPGRKVYFVAKINTIGDTPHFQGCRELYRRNGFAFFERVPAGR